MERVMAKDGDSPLGCCLDRATRERRMRLLLATMSHETNTFSPVPTKLDRFCRNGTTLLTGQAAIDHYRGTGTCMGGYLAVAAEVGAEIVVPVCASAPPAGRWITTPMKPCAG
jgi:microcystin degradation protein MlrC